MTINELIEKLTKIQKIYNETMPVYDNDFCGISNIEIITYKNKKSVVLRCDCEPCNPIVILKHKLK